METRKITVEEVSYTREFTTTTGFKIHYFKLKDTEGNYYEFSSNVKDQKKFIGSKTYEVTVETKQNRGGEYFFIDLSQAEKDRQKLTKGNSYSGTKKYYRTRAELLSIISQSSYEAATLLCIMFHAPIVSVTEISSVAKVLSTFIVESSELNSDSCKKEDPTAMRVANDKSIVYQKALKIAIQAFELKTLKLVDGNDIKGTRGIISLTEELFNAINKIASEL